MLGVRESGRRAINIWEIVYIVFLLGLCILLAAIRVNIDVIIIINGAVLGFVFVYLLPVMIHVRCLYFPQGKRPLSDKAIGVEGDISLALTHGASVKPRADKEKGFELTNINNRPDGQEVPRLSGDSRRGDSLLDEGDSRSSSEEEVDYSHYYCDVEKGSTRQQVLMITLLVVMFGIGVFVMVNGLIQVAHLLQ